MKLNQNAEQMREIARVRSRAAVRSTLDRTKPLLLGAVDAATLLDKREFIERGRAYRCGPISFEDGAIALHLLSLLEAVRREASPEKLHAWAVQLSVLSKRCASPVSLTQKALWLRPNYNPFSDATVWEAGERLAFFCALHLLDSGITLEEMGKLLLGTSSTPSPTSPNAGRAGVTRSGGRSRASAASRATGRSL